MALVRLLLPDYNIPATTAMESLNRNVIMFQKDNVKIDSDIIYQTQSGFEVEVFMGKKLAVKYSSLILNFKSVLAQVRILFVDIQFILY